MKKYKYLFCIVIFILLILPCIYFSKNDISKEENRGLSKFPAVIINGKINDNFGTEFDGWFSDRFGGRQKLIDLKFLVLYKINNRRANEKAFAGDNGWIFPTKGIKKIPPVKQQLDENRNLISVLKKIDDSKQGKNIQIYVVLEPSRSLLYKKYWERYYPYIPYHEYVKEMREELKEHPNVHLIDLKEDFEKNRNAVQLYEKNDPHMTIPAVNIMTDRIASELGNDFNEHYKKSVTGIDRNCKLYSFLNLYDDFLRIKSPQNNTICKEITTIKKNMEILDDEIGIREGFVSDAYMKKDLFILFPCYEEFVFPVLGEFFTHTVSVNYNVFEKHDDEALKNSAVSRLKTVKPNSVILLFLSYPTEYNISKSAKYLEAY